VAGYRTMEVLFNETDDSGRHPVEVSVEKQQRIRDDESTTRPFLKMRLVIGNRTIFCDINQARVLASLVQKMLPDAIDALSKFANQTYETPSHKEDTCSDSGSNGSSEVRRRVRRNVRTRTRYEDHEM